jgi:multisubunit Na+/H+ antiporter MnhG subunit
MQTTAKLSDHVTPLLEEDERSSSHFSLISAVLPILIFCITNPMSSVSICMSTRHSHGDLEKLWSDQPDDVHDQTHQ